MTQTNVDPIFEGIIKRSETLHEVLHNSEVKLVEDSGARFRIEVIGVKDGKWTVGAYLVDHLGFGMGGDLLHDTNSRLDKVIEQREKWDEVLYCRVLDLELDHDARVPNPYVTISNEMSREFLEMYDEQNAEQYIALRQKVLAWASYIRKSAADCLLAVAHGLPHKKGNYRRVAVAALAKNAVQFGQLNEVERDMVVGLIERQMEEESAR